MSSRSRRLVQIGVAVTVVLAIVTGCTSPPVPSPTAAPTKPTVQPTAVPADLTPTAASAVSKEPIKIGIVTSLTGSHDHFGAVQKHGYEMALEEINAAGGINGQPLQLVIEDDVSKPEQTAKVVEKLITRDKVPALIGSLASATTATAGTTANRYQTPLVMPSGSEDAILEQGSKWLFRVCAPASGVAKWAGSFLVDVSKPATLAIVYENTNDGTSVAAAAKKYAAEKGIKVVAFETYKPQDSDFKPVLQEVRAADPEAIFFASYLADATLLMRQSKELDINPKVFIAGGGGFSDNDFVKSGGAGKNAEYTLAASQWTPDAKWPGAREAAAKYQRQYNEVPRYYFAQAYATLVVMADALKRAGSLDKGKIRNALAKTDVMTLFGPVKFDGTGQNDHSMVITQVQNGQFVTVYPKDVAAGEVKLPTPPWSQRP